MLADAQEDVRLAEEELRNSDMSVPSSSPATIAELVAQAIAQTPEQKVLMKNALVALDLMTKNKVGDARPLLEYLLEQCKRWAADLADQPKRHSFLGRFATTCGRFLVQCDAQQCSGSASKHLTLRSAHLLMLKEVAHTLEHLGPAKIPREVTWSFLRNPYEFVLYSDSRLQAVSLQNGRQIHDQSVDLEPYRKFMLEVLLNGKHRNLFTIAHKTGLPSGFQGTPGVDDLTVEAMPVPMFLAVTGREVKVRTPPPAEYFSDKVVLHDRDRDCKLLRAGFVAISVEEGWFACWASRGAHMIMLGDLTSTSSYNLMTGEEELEKDEWKICALVASGKYLFAANEALLQVFEILREDGQLAWKVCDHDFDSDKSDLYYMHIAAISARNDSVAALIHPNIGSSYSYVDVLCVAVGGDLNLKLQQRVYGSSFTDVELTEDLILTITSEYPFVVQAWPTKGLPQCLYQWTGITQELASLHLKPSGASRKFGLPFIGSDPPVAGTATFTEEDASIAKSEVLAPLAEDAALIYPEEAAAVADELWASNVQQIIAGNSCCTQTSDTGIPAIVLTFSRHTPELERVLLASPAAHSAQERGVDIKPALANGAKVFVEGIPTSFLEELSSWHVVLREEDEDTIHAALQSLPYNVRKLKPQGKHYVPAQLTLMGVSDDEAESYIVDDAVPFIEYRVRHTFIEILPEDTLDTRSVKTA